MAIAFIAATEAGSGSATNSQAINVPGGVVDDDLLLLFATIADGDTDSIATPAGWTEVVNNVNTGGAAPSPPGMSVFQRIASSEPGSYTINQTDTPATGFALQMLAFSGVDTTTPIDVAATTATGDGTNANPPSINYADSEATIVVGACWDSTTGVYSAVPTNYTSPSGLGAVTGNGGGNGCTMATAFDLTPAGDPEDPGTYTSASEQWASATVALRAAPVGGNFDQTSFQGYADDAGLDSATSKAAVNTDWNQRQDENFRVRFLIQEDDDVEDLNVEFQLQYNLNAAGWNDVNGASSVVRSFASPNVTDGASTTQQIGAGTFIGSQNGFDEVNGLAGGSNMDWTTTVNQETEVEFCVQIRSADTSRGDTIDLRIIKEPDIALTTYTNTPTLTIPVGAGMQIATAQLLAGAAGAQNPAAFNFDRSLPWGAITLALRVASGASSSNLSAGTKFNTITTPTMTVRDGATVDGITIDGDVVWDDVEDMTGVTITGSLTIGTAGTYTFNNVTVLGDVTNSDAGGNVLINVSNGSSISTSEPGSGNGQVNIQNTVTVSVNAKSISNNTNIEAARVLLEPADNTGPLPWKESVTIVSTGTTASVTHSAHGMTSGSKVKIRGANESAYNGVFVISNVATGSYDYTMSSDPVDTATGTIVATAVILDGNTNASGILEDTAFNYTAEQNVAGRIRKNTASPRYKTAPMSGTITSTGFTATVFMIDDE